VSLDRHEPLLDVRGLRKGFPVTRGLLGRVVGEVKAVDGVSFHLHSGETLCLVGESGSGKTTTARTLLRLVEPSAGEAFVRLQGEPLDFFTVRMRPHALRGPLWLAAFLLLHTVAARTLEFPGTTAVNLVGLGLLGIWLVLLLVEAREVARQTRRVRKSMQIVFQDPHESLNPRMSVGEAIAEPLRVHFDLAPREVESRVGELLDRVGLSPEARTRFPHEFSGGQRQRICIARALALEPRLLVCDEVLSALDVSVQAQILNLFSELQRDLDLAYLFIAHDLAVVRHIADRIHVMYLGRIVEEGTAADIFERPAHPYTKTLLAAMPGARRLLAPESRPLESQPGEELVPSGDVPSALDPPEGCPFHPRCAFAEERCRLAYPERRELSASHVAACHLLDPDESPPSEPG